MGFLAIPYPAIDPVALRIGPLAVKWYGLAYVAGLLLGRYYVKALLQQGRLWPSEKRPFTPEKVDDLLLFMTVGVLLGGRLGYVLFYQPQFFLTHPLEIVAVWNGGMSFHGALLASIVAVVLFARRVGADPWSVLDLCAALHDHKCLALWLQRGQQERSALWVYLPLLKPSLTFDAEAEAQFAKYH